MSSYFTYSDKLEALFAENGELLSYAKGQHVVWQHEESEWVFFLVSGYVRVVSVTNGSPQRIIGFFVPGAVFAKTGSFINESDNALSYICEGPCQIYRLKKSVFLKQLHRNPLLCTDYMEMLLRNQHTLIARIVYQGEKHLQNKCLRWLEFMAKFYGTSGPQRHTVVITIPLNQTTIADFLHTTRESVNTTLRTLSQQGIISIERKQITIHDTRRLKIG